MELIKILDEYGNETGEILDRNIAHDKNLLHNEISVFLINESKEVLLQKRSINKRYNPGKWGSCAGHVEINETLKESALRELKEEIGLEINYNDLHEFYNKEIIIKTDNSHVKNYFYCFSNLKEDKFEIQKEELSEVKWFLIDDVIKNIKSNTAIFTFDTTKIPVLEALKKVIKVEYN